MATERKVTGKGWGSIAALGAILCCSIATSAHAQSECVAGEAVSAQSILDEAREACCGKKKNKRTQCLRNAVDSLRGVRSIISLEVYNGAKASIDALRRSKCDSTQVRAQACVAEISTTTTEAIAAVEGSSCDLKLRSKRQEALKRSKRRLNKSKRFLQSSFVTQVNSGISSLQRSKSCGKGGKKSPATECSRVVDPRDGAIVGNVYKLSDEDGKPVFLTHNGARSGKALRPNGAFIENLRYTGLGNADGRGRRHHYRMHTSCRDLPRGFLLKIGSTCYEISSPCSRID